MPHVPRLEASYSQHLIEYKGYLKASIWRSSDVATQRKKSYVWHECAQSLPIRSCAALRTEYSRSFISFFFVSLNCITKNIWNRKTWVFGTRWSGEAHTGEGKWTDGRDLANAHCPRETPARTHAHAHVNAHTRRIARKRRYVIYVWHTPRGFVNHRILFRSVKNGASFNSFSMPPSFSSTCFTLLFFLAGKSFIGKV